VADLPLCHPTFGQAQPCPRCFTPVLKAKRLSRDYGASGIEGSLRAMTFHAQAIRSTEEMGQGQPRAWNWPCS
jgi:hypothetical protein